MKRLVEESVMFASILKWVFLSTIIGVLVGLATSFFLNILNWGIKTANRYPYYFLLVPLAFVFSALLIKYLAPEAEGHGTEKVIEAVHKRSGKINAMVVPVKLVATVVTIALGGSAGKEGPCAQIGGGLASLFADIFRFDDNERKKLVVCGISAGFASVFGTPIAGAIFGVEVLFVGNILYEVLLPSFIAGVTSFQVSSALGTQYFYHPVNFVPVFSESFFLKVVFAGIFFGACSFILIETLRLGEELSRKLNAGPVKKGIIGGIAMILLSLVFSKTFLGLGLNTIQSALQGDKIPWYAFILKAVFTSITLNFGGSGGIVTPIFFIGATAGSLFAKLFGLSLATFSAIGFVSLLAGAANTPIAASIMAVEFFGPQIAPYAAVACVISFLMTGHRSVYPSQVLSIQKSPSIHVEFGKEMEDIEIQYHPRKRTLDEAAVRIFKKIFNRGGGSS